MKSRTFWIIMTQKNYSQISSCLFPFFRSSNMNLSCKIIIVLNCLCCGFACVILAALFLPIGWHISNKEEPKFRPYDMYVFHVLFTARIRRVGEGNSFSLSIHTPGGTPTKVGTSPQGQGTSPSQGRYPSPGQGRYPSPTKVGTPQPR